jgi:hypothetical protein
MSEANDLANRNPEPPTGGEAYTDLLCAVVPYYWLSNYDVWNIIIYIISNNLRRRRSPLFYDNYLHNIFKNYFALLTMRPRHGWRGRWRFLSPLRCLGVRHLCVTVAIFHSKAFVAAPAAGNLVIRGPGVVKADQKGVVLVRSPDCRARYSRMSWGL